MLGNVREHQLERLVGISAEVLLSAAGIEEN